MKKQYKKMFKNTSFYTFLLVLLMISNAFGQVINKVPFTLRTSSMAPEPYKNKSIYNLRGDFTMIGNANLFDSRVWGNKPKDANANNGLNSYMAFYKLPNEISSIKNSSSSTLVHPSGFDASCTTIVYVGLYWSGRGDNTDADVLPNGLNKKKIKLKLPGQSSYQELTANGIYKGTSTESGIYSSYVDITDKVRALGNNAWGTYSVADVATTIGDGGSVGYFGGWGMVVIYENSMMKWRDITVFDGYSFIESSNEQYRTGILNVQGFRAAQNGNVNIKMGMMAGEGDSPISGDSFEIKKRLSSDWEKLKHSSNGVDNFFNSTVLISPNTRVPNYTNNYGTDIVMFDLGNIGNKFIDNGQTETSFRFGTNQDTYIIYNITFAVDAYVPEVEAENNILTNNVVHNASIVPDQLLDFEIALRNKGTEAVKNGKLEIPIPPSMHFVSASVDQTLPVKGTVTWTHPNSTDSNITPGGTLTWEFDQNLPFGDILKILGKLKYKLRVSNDCTLLTTSANGCILNININGKVTGTGVTSGNAVNAPLVRGYGQGACPAPIFDDLQLKIIVDNSFLANCPNEIINNERVFTAFCANVSDVIPRSDVVNSYPAGTKFYSQEPGTSGYESSIVTGDFPLSTSGKLFYAVVLGAQQGCYLKLRTVLENIETVPTVSSVQVCEGEYYELNNQLSANGVQRGLSLYYFASENATVPLENIPNPTQVGSHIYYVSEGKVSSSGSCFGNKVAFNITINELPVIDSLPVIWEFCPNADATYQFTSDANQTIIWEYTLSSQPTVWYSLLLAPLGNNVLTANQGELKVSHANSMIDKLQIRAKVINENGCATYSNPMLLSLKSCNAITNPSLPSKAGK